MMIETKDVDNLANLARVAIADAEKDDFRRDLDEILTYVSQVKDAGGRGQQQGRMEYGGLRNVMRDDRVPHMSGIFTEVLLSTAPSREDNYVLVKKILP